MVNDELEIINEEEWDHLEFPKKKRIENKKMRQKITMYSYCLVCGIGGNLDCAHIKSRGAGGDDVEDNMVALCRKCHSLQHKMGWVYMWETYQCVRNELQRKGWELESGRLRQPNSSCSQHLEESGYGPLKEEK